MRPINFRDLVSNIIEKEYDRLGLYPLNKVVIDNVVWFAWDISDDLMDMAITLEDDLYSLYDGRKIKDFDVSRVVGRIYDCKYWANYCSV
jgi:hypothetical protein